MSKLIKLRNKIDSIDSEIITLLNKRAKHALKIGRVKKMESKSIKDRTRESSMKQNIILQNEGPMDNNSIVRIYDTIIESMIDLQENECQI